MDGADVAQADIATKKKELVKLSAQVKSRQKEVQTAEIEFRESFQCRYT